MKWDAMDNKKYGNVDSLKNQMLVGDGGRRDKAILHMLCVLDGLLDVLVKGVKLVKFLLNLVSSHGWLGLSTQPTYIAVDRWKKKVKALGANGDLSGSRVGVVWMEVGGGIVRARVVSRVVVKVVLVVLIGWEVEELALEAMEYDDQGMGYKEGLSSCDSWKLVHVRNGIKSVVVHRIILHPLVRIEEGELDDSELEGVEVGDEAFFPHA
uniref:Uncharacterized protein n=1 Tax=Tanacetum cinerariifolium TaxID=118510 RepID=A0A6L2MD42_TANCI|nr:hypothetical protein [Tanacetum cinerariifolium]